MKTIYETLQGWAALSGNALKAQVLADLQPDVVPGIRTYLTYALDPSRTYGVKGKMAGGDPFLGCQWGGREDWDILDRLASRKLTGNAAKLALAEWGQLSSTQDNELMNRVLNKDLRCGVGTTLLNDVGAEVDFHIPVFEVALCKTATAKLIKSGTWLSATKYDGIRALIQVRDNAVSFFTRSGKLIPALDHLAPAVLEIFGGQEVMLDSEAVSGNFQASVSTLRRSKNIKTSGDETLQVFDMVGLAAFLKAGPKDVFGETLDGRLANLEAMVLASGVEHSPLKLVEHTVVQNWAHAHRLFSEALAREEEGVILRDAGQGYRKARTTSWLKLKLEDSIDARIVDVYEGEGKYAGMLGGAVIVVEGRRCNVGGGWSDVERAEAWAAATGQAVHYTLDGKDYVAEPDEECNLIDRIIEAKFNGYTDDGALRHGRKKRFRDIEGEKA